MISRRSWSWHGSCLGFEDGGCHASVVTSSGGPACPSCCKAGRSTSAWTMLWHAKLQLRAAACFAVQAETLQMGGEATVAAAAGMADDHLSQAVQDQAGAQARDLFRRAVQAYEQVCRPRRDVSATVMWWLCGQCLVAWTGRLPARLAQSLSQCTSSLCLCLTGLHRVTESVFTDPAADCCSTWLLKGLCALCRYAQGPG